MESICIVAIALGSRSAFARKPCAQLMCDPRGATGWRYEIDSEPAGRDRDSDEAPFRCFVIGTAGTGKSHTLRGFAGFERLIVEKAVEARSASARFQTQEVKETDADAVRHCCQLVSPTGGRSRGGGSQ